MLCIDQTVVAQVWEKVFGVNITAAANAEIYSPLELGNQITGKAKAVKRVGFIGLGAMGFGMASSLLKSNFCVIGFDVIYTFHFLLHCVLNKNTLASNHLCGVLWMAGI